MIEQDEDNSMEEPIASNIFHPKSVQLSDDEVSQKISNIDKTIENRSIHIDLNSKEDGSNSNHKSSSENPQSLMSLHSHKSETHSQDLTKKVEGPQTLISHLNDPNNEIIVYNDDEKMNSERAKEQISPLDTNIIIPSIKEPTLKKVQISPETNTQQAENLLKYLENKLIEKKQESSSLFDQSRTSM